MCPRTLLRLARSGGGDRPAVLAAHVLGGGGGDGPRPAAGADSAAADSADDPFDWQRPLARAEGAIEVEWDGEGGEGVTRLHAAYLDLVTAAVAAAEGDEAAETAGVTRGQQPT